jgi:mRNA interferase HigB
MRIIARQTLRRFVEALPDHKDQPAVKAALDVWFDEVRKEKWTGTAHVKRRYPAARIVSPERILFHIEGSACRLVVAADFEKGILWIKGVDAHEDHDVIDVAKVDHHD